MNDKAVSALLEYLIVIGILSMFVLFLGLILNAQFAEGETGVVLQNQFSDVASQVSSQLVDIFAITPENGRVTAKIYMPKRIGDYEYHVGFSSVSNETYIFLQSDKGNFRKYVGVGKLDLDMTLQGSTFSMSKEHGLNYTRTSHILPTAVLMVSPSTLLFTNQSNVWKTNNTANFRICESFAEGGFNWTLEFGDGNSTSGDSSICPSGIITHYYYWNTTPYNVSAHCNVTDTANMTAICQANLTITDELGYSDAYSVNITFTKDALAVNPDLYIDKYIIPKEALVGQPVEIHIYIQGQGLRTSPRDLSVVHVIDKSGSMRDYTQYMKSPDTGTNSITPTIWERSFNISNESGILIKAYTNDTNNIIRNKWYQNVGTSSDAAEAIQLFVKSPSTDYVEGIETMYQTSPYMVGKRFSQNNPENGEWRIRVIGVFPDVDGDSTDLHVDVYKYDSETTEDVDDTFYLESGNGYHYNYTFNITSDVDQFRFSAESYSFWWFLWFPDDTTLNLYDPNNNLVYSDTDTSHTITVENPISGQWTAEFSSDGYRRVDIALTKYIKQNLTLLQHWDDTLTSNSDNYQFNLPTDCFKLKIETGSNSNFYLWIDGPTSNPDRFYTLPYENASDSSTINPSGTYSFYLVPTAPTTIDYYTTVYVAKIDGAKIAAMNFNSMMGSGDYVGLVSYSSCANIENIENYLTTNKDTVNSSIQSLSPGGWTNIGHSLEKAKQIFDSYTPPDTIPAVILMSDGIANCCNQHCGGYDDYFSQCGSYCGDSNNCLSEAEQYALDMADALKSNNVTIYTICFGDDADEDLMGQISSEGYCREALTAEDLTSIYGQIATELRDFAAKNVTVSDVIPNGITIDYSGEINMTCCDPLGRGDCQDIEVDISETPNGTLLQWNISKINITEECEVTITVHPHSSGEAIPMDVINVSNVTYQPYPATCTDPTDPTCYKVFELPVRYLKYSAGEASTVELQ
ncbi:hypothetical protein DRP05_02905 [Archaeoglobales archaeon]|nr:MAG: hypothetical protein DRP05_02905 [Archaeoglobales archaeon]